MAIPFKKFGYKLNPISEEIETPQVFLVNKKLEKMGELYPVDDLHITINEVNVPNEVSFDYYKFVNGRKRPFFDDLMDLSVVQIGSEFFEVSVTKSETDVIVKRVVGESLGFAELSQILGTLEVNTDDDMARSGYDSKFPTVFYREEKFTDSEDVKKKKRNSSLLHRILTYAPHYSVDHVDPTLRNVQRTFSWNDTDIISILNDISEEIGCVYDVQITINENGEAERRINFYDALYCKDCYEAMNDYEKQTTDTHSFRNIVNGICQNCGSSEHIVEIGEDSGIFISTDNLSDEISVVGNRDNIKNCFKVVGGDDVITATVQGLNLSANNRIMMFSDEQKKLMSEELVSKIEQYNTEYDSVRDTYEKLLETQYNIYDMILYLKSGKMPLAENTVTTIPDAIIEALDQIRLVYQKHFYVKKREEFGYASVNYAIKNLFTAFLPQGFSFTIDTDELIDTEFYGWTGKIRVYRTGNRDDFYTLDVGRLNSTVTHGKLETPVTFPVISDRNLVNQFRVRIYFANTNEEQYLTYLKQHTACLLKTLDLTYENQQKRNWEEFCYERLKSFYDGYCSCIESLDDMLVSADFESEKIIRDMQSSYESIKQDIHEQMKVLMDEIFALSFYAGEFSDEFLNKDGTVSYQLQSLSGVLEAFHGMVSPESKGGYYNDVYVVNEYIGTKPCKCMDCMSINVSPSVNGNVCNNCGGSHVYSYADMMEEIVERFETDYHEEPRMDYVCFVNLMDQRKAIQEKFDTKTYFGEALYKELLSFIREDVYRNENYTSDGLTNAQIISQSKELIAKASQELSKACMNQYTITASVSSILSQTEFEFRGVPVVDIYSGFTINNRVHVKIDGDVYTLRIASIRLTFPVTDKTEVTFTNATSYLTGAMDDVVSAVKGAASMATTYSYVATQAEKGKEASAQFDTMKKEGLDACLMAVKGGQDQDVIIDNHGILLRKRIPEADAYSPYQMKMINRNIVMTKDDWKTSSLAIGLGQYNGEPVYGIWSDLLVGDLVITKDLRVENENQSVIIDKDGITLNGGAIKWTEKLPSSSVDGLDDTLKTFVEKTLYNQDISDLQNQIDGNITTWFDTHIPSANNEPATNWTTYEERVAHEGDLFYCTDENNAHAYRYIYDNTDEKHKWILIKDTDVTKALADAATAQKTANGKRRVFVITPVPPYDEGDLWAQGENGDIMRCKVTRLSGNYVASDWIKASKYTDDAKAVEVENSLNAYKEEISNFKTKVDDTLSFTKLTEMGDDYVISPKIGGGYLYIANGDYSVEIDPKHVAGDDKTKDGYLFCIRNKGGDSSDDNVVMGVDTSGNGVFRGKITATSGYIGGESGWKISGSSILNSGSAIIKTGTDDTYTYLMGGELYSRGSEDSVPTEDSYKSVWLKNGAIWCQRVNKEPNKKYATAITSDMIEMQGNNGSPWIQANMISNKINIGWDTTVTSFYSTTKFHNSTKFYGDVRFHGTETDYVRLSVMTHDTSAANAYLVNDGSMKIGYRLQVGDATVGYDPDHTFRVVGSSFVTGTSYTNSGTTVTSDRNKKKSISVPSDDYIKLFDSIEFKKYKYNDGTSDRFHLGVIAQEVEEAMKSVGISAQDFGGLVIDGQGNYFVRYDEINILTALKVKQLENKIKQLEEKLNNLTTE